MKSICVKFLATLFTAVTVTSPALAATPLAPPATANDLAWTLFQKLTKPGENAFLSPASLTTAIGLAYEGTGLESRSRVRAFLRLPSPRDPNAPLIPSAYFSFKTTSDSVKLEAKNGIWFDPKGFQPKPAFIERVEKAFDAKVAKHTFGDGVDISREINSWVKDATHSMIARLVSPGDLKGQHAAVLNAVYFLGTWENKFEVTSTYEDDFTLESGTKAKTKFMNQTQPYAFAETPTFSLIHLPYKNSNFAMSIVIPKAGTKLSDLERSLSVTAFESPTKMQKVWLKLPKFNLDWGPKNAAPELIALGLPEILPRSQVQDLGAKDDFVLGAVLHRAVVKVDESGTEASAATAVTFRAGSAPMDPPAKFHADRPFVFAIRDVKRNEILFIGRMTQPN